MSIENVSRRGVLKGVIGTGAFGLALPYAPPLFSHHPAPDAQTEADRAPRHPNIFMGIHTDAIVHIVMHRSEMGTAISIDIPMFVSEELDAEWNRMKNDQAICDKRYGDQNCYWSHYVRNFSASMR